MLVIYLCYKYMMNLCFNIKDEAHAKEIQTLMQNTIEFKVPSVVEYGLGESWGDAK